MIISDEAYFEFVDDDDYPDTLQYLKDHKNLIILQSFSKVMGLAGLRVGYAMGLTCYKSNSNFIMVDVGRDADFVFKELLKKGIIVRPLKAQGTRNGLRITVLEPKTGFIGFIKKF